jgi:hypothetical protein
VDVYAGRVTRSHDDVDLAVWLDDRPRIAGLLAADGWRHAPSPDDDGGTGFTRGAVRVELTFLDREADGRVVMPMRAGPVPWPEDSLGDDRGERAGVRPRLLALSTLVAWKAAPREDEDGAKDRADHAVLSELAG